MELSFSSFFFFFPERFFFPEAALCLLWSSGQVGTLCCLRSLENALGVGHCTDPAQGMGLLLFIDFSVAES